MKHWIKALSALSMVMCACNPLVLDPLDVDPSEIEVGDDPGDGPASGAPSAIAMRLSQLVFPPNNADVSFQVSAMPSLPPDALVLFFASRTQSCESPVIVPDTSDSLCASQAYWQATFVLPPALAVPGAMIDLADPSIAAYQAIWMASCGGGSGGGPGAYVGTLEIVSIDATSAQVKLDLAPSTSWGTQNGDYTATFCF